MGYRTHDLRRATTTARAAQVWDMDWTHDELSMGRVENALRPASYKTQRLSAKQKLHRSATSDNSCSHRGSMS
jgi:hypothetical protein